MSKELIERLRLRARIREQAGDNISAKLFDQAADELEAQAAKIKTLTEALADLVAQVDEEIEPNFCAPPFSEALNNARKTLGDQT